MPCGIITLTTDFGTADTFVAQMKGVILGMAPQAQIVDITHEVPPQDILAGAFLLSQAVSSFPQGTIHVAVVDPGVGGARAPLLLDSEAGIFIGPDNGVLSFAARQVRGAFRIEAPAFRREEVSATFEGRDLFAPAAARLLLGAPASSAGPRLSDFVRLPEEGQVAKILHVDRFGNLITSLRAGDVHGARAIVSGAFEAPLRRTYGDVAIGEPVAYVGSAGFIEIAVRNGSAARGAGAGRGARVEVRR